MDERKKKVLNAIIKDYVATAEPVGSRTIAKKYSLGVSPATIRNEMSDLEDLGYIEQPHTSAGRIPSDKGYRYFVDCLMEKEELDAGDIQLVTQFFTSRLTELDQMVRETCQMVSKLTKYTAMVLVPRRSEGKLEKLQLVPVDAHRILVVVVTDTGLINHRLVELPHSVDPDRLKGISDLLQSRLYGLSLEQVNMTLMREISRQIPKEEQLLDLTLDLMEQALLGSGEEQVFTGGTLNLLDQPEFRDLEKVRSLLSTLEEDAVVRRLLLRQTADAPGISIGGEIPFAGINQCSVVTGVYKVNGKVVGSVGLLGPTRMAYSKAVSIVELVTGQMSQMLDRKSQK